MRAVIYCRVSTVEQRRISPCRFRRKATAATAPAKATTSPAVFVDRGESARTTERPEFQRLLAYCRQHKPTVHAVVVYGLSRFSRTSADHHAIAAVLRSAGIALRSVTEPIDDSPAGRSMGDAARGDIPVRQRPRGRGDQIGMRRALA